MSRLIGEFKRLSPMRQAAIIAITAWNLWLSISAERDISRRSADEVRGNRILWRLLCLTNTAGPLAYFKWGLRTRS